MMMDEADLLRRARSGDRAAFGELVSRHQAAVYRVARGILRDPAEAEDATQETFVKAWENLSRFRGESGFFTWLYRIAVNAALMAGRRRPKTVKLVIDRELPRDPDEGEPTMATLEKLLGELPPEARAILILRDLEGLSYREISDTLEVPMGTVESRIFRAREELRAKWRAMRTTGARP